MSIELSLSPRLVCVVVSYLYANDECIIMRVVETLSIFF